MTSPLTGAIAPDKVVPDAQIGRAPVVIVPVVETVPPPPLGVAHVPSPRQNVEDAADVPELRLVTGKLPVTPPAPPVAKLIAGSTEAIVAAAQTPPAPKTTSPFIGARPAGALVPFEITITVEDGHVTPPPLDVAQATPLMKQPAMLIVPGP